MFNKTASFFLCLLLAPIILILYIAVKMSSQGPFFFTQTRLGKNKKPFTIYKIRTMIPDAENLKKKYHHLNEAQLPAFKISNDPRYTKIGKLLSHTGLDELPQLINIIKGEMAFIGPRPLPVEEANRVPLKYQKRFDVLPGITSLWVVKGAHTLSFDEWMELDTVYTQEKNFHMDLHIGLLTIMIIIKQLIRSIPEALSSLSSSNFSFASKSKIRKEKNASEKKE